MKKIFKNYMSYVIMNPVSPYKNVEQYTKVLLEPYQMNSDLDNNLKLNLKKKIEKKCNKNGYVDFVYKLLNYKDGKMYAENLSGNALYDIKYLCRLCLPIENSIIVAQVVVINHELVVTVNGPIMTFIPRNKIDTTIWNISENFKHNKKENTYLKVKDYVLVQLTNEKINKGDGHIKTMGTLLDLASEKQVKDYYENITEMDVNEIGITNNEESNFII